MKKVLTVAFLSLSLAAFSQDNVVDVLIDNKPAKLNITTGDYKFIDGSLNKTIDKTPGLHVVQKGETLYSISKKYDISIAQIKSVNNLSSNYLKVDQKLAIGYSTSRIIVNKNTHTVVKGDTLYSIAKSNNISVSYLKELNGLQNNIISIGQVLMLK
ncbi:LysM peptidoglycan-binding domain-containing protein [Lacinutrix sp. 5H-3-7-4]|uniref:LysM peptidoglycan-binding domain-containing protein n=1 Tax=Lacinutrix sp. (strain 5H-3-7-4) TaxID=983544 RepID=UPI00020A3E7A|nr:LysM peptidoglycan-binding domain-containing protein [Lacinutrix sp. 5H-3-7-4]AEH02510.1 Peptidoglycan-binding lysin domain protein [Lacinutrix sp. 5H-3-7-4]